LTDARPIACTGKTSLHSLPRRRPNPPGATYEVAETVQTSGATSLRSTPCWWESKKTYPSGIVSRKIHMVEATTLFQHTTRRRSIMPAVRIVTQDDVPHTPVTTGKTSTTRVWAYLGVTLVLLTVIGTWLVWFSACIQRNLQEDDIRAACRRVMPDAADRCFDTVVIQRGGVRR
jgi:hypothetical protein